MYYDDIRLSNPINFVRQTGILTEHDVHTHDVLEINVLLENEAKYRLLKKDYHGKPGDIFLYQPFEPHWTLAKDEMRPTKSIMILFSSSVIRSIPKGYKLLAPFYTTDLFSPLIPADSFYARVIQVAASRAVEEQEQRIPGWQAKRFMYFIEVLVNLYRYYIFERSKVDMQKMPNEEIISVIEHILIHFLEEIDIGEIIHRMGLRKTSFHQKFKQVTSVTPNEFINHLRLQYSIYLLDYTDKSVTDVAFESGFNSLNYFNKRFKEHRGMSPREHRKREQEKTMERDP